MQNNRTSRHVGAFLRKARKEKNMTGKQLAKLMNISQQQISRYETGKTSLTLDMLSELLPLLDKYWSEILQVIQQSEKENGTSEVNENDIYLSLSKYLTDSVLR